MQATILRRLATRCLRLAGLAKDEEEAMRMRLAAADYLEKADQQPAAQQQQQIQPDKKED